MSERIGGERQRPATPARSGERLEGLPAARRELLRRLLQGRAQGIAPRPPGLSVIPASYGQQRLWFLSELDPGDPVYQISQALPIDGALDPPTVERALGEVARRHEVLRTTFATVDGQPVQVIAGAARPGWRWVDLVELPADERERRAREVMAAEAREPFDLGRGPLLRATLVRLATERHLLLLTLHHAVADGWSMAVLLREIEEVHAAFAAGEPSPLPELPIQYADYALWQRAQLTPERVAASLGYWRRQLADAPRLRLPTDRPRGGSRSRRGAREFFRLDEARLGILRELARREGATLFMALLAVFQVLLGRYSGEEDLVVAAPVAGRERPETEGLIGFFLNTLCLRTSLRGDPTFRELLAQVRITALAAFQHQDLPFDLLVEAMAPERGDGDGALFDVMFVLQTGSGGRAAAVDATSVDAPAAAARAAAGFDGMMESGTSKCDLTLSVLETSDGLVGALEYATDLFDAATAARIVAHFQQLVASACEHPHQRISALDMLTAAERRQQLGEWNATAAEYPQGVCVHQLVAAQAARSPEAVAVIGGSGAETLTFRELETRSNQLAHHLLLRGARRGERIGVTMERTPDLLVAMLATWKAGCAWVAIDPDLPAARAERIATEAEVREILAAPLPWPELARQPRDAPQVPVDPRDLAYLLFTSGSTGGPKGVMVEHGSVVNYLTWVEGALLAAEPRAIAATSRPSFDASLKQLWAPLLAGRPVWLVPEEVVADPARLLALLPRRGDFTLNCVPWLWSTLLDHLAGAPAARRHLKRLLLGGEELTRELVDRTFALLPDLELWNLYGPSEVTANATAARLLPGAPISIGRPIANATALVLDRNGGLAPVGVTGELHVGGVGLARGYWRSPQTTAERFVGDPFGGGRLFRTGDLVRRRADGCLEFLGRLDQQVKLRGFRLELGEVEAALAAHPAVRRAAAAVDGVGRGPQLVAYAELHAPGAASTAELRRFLVAALPDYMVPARIVLLEALPRNAHGKIDRRALAAASPADGNGEWVAPRTAEEAGVASIWEAVLDAAPIGAHASFFALGGHSLLLAQVLSRIRQAFGVEVPLRELFDEPTVEGCAAAIVRARAASAHAAPAIRRLDRDRRRQPGEESPAAAAPTGGEPWPR